MMDNELQSGLIKTIQLIAQERIKNVNFTKSYTGIVISMDGNKAMVEIFGNAYECIIPNNLSNYIEKDDIVVIQDISNNKVKRVVQGVISSLNKFMFHIYDPVEDKIVSSVLQLWDDELQKPIDVVFELE
jgi:hypothetical protein